MKPIELLGACASILILIIIATYFTMTPTKTTLKNIRDFPGYKCFIDEMNQVIIVLTPDDPEHAFKLCNESNPDCGTQFINNLFTFSHDTPYIPGPPGSDWTISIESIKPGFSRKTCKLRSHKMSDATISQILNILIEQNETLYASHILEHYLKCESEWLGSWRPEEAQARREQLDAMNVHFTELINDRIRECAHKK